MILRMDFLRKIEPEVQNAAKNVEYDRLILRKMETKSSEKRCK